MKQRQLQILLVHHIVADQKAAGGHTGRRLDEVAVDEEEESLKVDSILTKSDSLRHSIARSKNKANDLMAMIDGVLSNGNSSSTQNSPS